MESVADKSTTDGMKMTSRQTVQLTSVMTSLHITDVITHSI